MKGDLDMTVREDELGEKGRPLIDCVKPVECLLLNGEVYGGLAEDQADEDVDYIAPYESGIEGGDGSDYSDEVHGKEVIDVDDVEDVEGVEKDEKGREEGDDDDHMTDEGETSGSGLGSRMRDLGRPDSISSSRLLHGEAAEDRFCTSTQEIGEHLLGQAIPPKDFFTSPEDQQDSIENIFTKTKRFLAGNARLIIDLEAAAREQAAEQGIEIKEMDRIDREMDRPTLLNLASQNFTHRVKQEPEHY